MNLTNKFGLPQTLINLYEKQREEYSETKGDVDVSVTQLIKAPQIDILRKRHFHEMEEDVSDRLWAILGTVIHRIMVDGADEEHIPEENLTTTMMGWKIKGGIDVQKKGNHYALMDYKFTKAFKYMKKDFKDWEEQLNCYAYLVREVKGSYVDTLHVILFIRDFAPGLVDKQKDYPQASSIPVDIPLWTKEAQKEFLEARIKAHQDAQRAGEWGEALPECTDRDRWKHEDVYIVKKKGAVRALRTFGPDIKEAGNYKMTMKKPDDYEVILRPGKPARCIGNYCGVNKWCDQWAKEKDTWKNEE